MNGRNQYTIMYIESSSLDPSCYVVDLPNAKNCDVLRQRKVLHVLLPYTTQTGADRPTLQLYHRTLLRRESNESKFQPSQKLFSIIPQSRRLPMIHSSFTFIFLRNNNEQAPLTSKLLSTEHTLNHHERNLRKDESSLNHERAAVHQRRRHW